MDITYSVKDLAKVAKQLVEAYSDYKVWIFNGEMGAGKTTLIKSICEELGVRESMSSPTFSIVNQYHSANEGIIYHFDFYRIEEIEEAIDIGVEDYLFSGDSCLIEWPDIILSLLPDKYLEISINLVNDRTRSLTALIHERTR